MSKFNTRLEHERIRRAGRSGAARKEFVERARQLVSDSDQGRASSACMIELKKALNALDERIGGSRP